MEHRGALVGRWRGVNLRGVCARGTRDDRDGGGGEAVGMRRVGRGGNPGTLGVRVFHWEGKISTCLKVWGT